MDRRENMQTEHLFGEKKINSPVLLIGLRSKSIEFDPIINRINAMW